MSLFFSHEPLFDVEGNGECDHSLDKIYAEVQKPAYGDISSARGRISSISSSQGSAEHPDTDTENKESIGKDISVIPEEEYLEEDDCAISQGVEDISLGSGKEEKELRGKN